MDKTLERYKIAANELASAVNHQLFDDSRQWYWVFDIVGGACEFDDCDILSTDDMVLILEHGMTYDEYAEWKNANIDNSHYINLYSWLHGARHYMLNK